MRDTPTLPDLVVLSLLAERAMDGRDLWSELQRRQVPDWALISRAQVYYALRKLASMRLVSLVGPGMAPGPERQVYTPSPEGRAVLARALAESWWTRHRDVSPFLTWLALAPHGRGADARAHVASRRAYLEAELARERATRDDLERAAAPGAPGAPRRLVVSLAIRRHEAELAWLDEVEQAVDAGELGNGPVMEVDSSG